MLDTASLYDGTTSQKRSGMARFVRYLTVLPALIRAFTRTLTYNKKLADKPPDAGLVRFCDFYLPISNLTPSMRGSSQAIGFIFGIGMAGLQAGEGRTMTDSVVWAQYINVTDTQTATSP